MFDTVINYLDKFGPELLVIQFGLLVILSTLFLWLWFSNRRKYHNLKHAIPANVVKNYLDSIIQNSTALKSSLFRGGGVDVSGSIPSVMPLNNLIGGENMGVSGAPSTALLEEINQKKAQISSLESQLLASQNSQKELEAKLSAATSASSSSSNVNVEAYEKRIKELEALLAQNRDSGNGDEALKSELSNITKERDEIRDRLREFEIISDDLANLKRLQQENQQLKKTLEGLQGGAAPVAEAPAQEEKSIDPENIINQADVSDLFQDLGNTPSGNEENKALEDFLAAPEESPASEAPAEELLAAAEEAPSEDENNKADKTPEDLLSEFEKMLG